jgi:hypothetical protein
LAHIVLGVGTPVIGKNTTLDFAPAFGMACKSV